MDFIGFFINETFAKNDREGFWFGLVGVALDQAQTLPFSLSSIVEMGRFINLMGLSPVRGGA